MKKTLIYFGIFLVIVLCAFIAGRRSRKGEINRLENNQTTFLSEINRYKTKDSLNAVQVGVLNLRLKEYEHFRAEDAKTIESLKTQNRELTNITTQQSQYIAELEVPVKDTVVVSLENGEAPKIDTLQKVDYHDDWLDFSGIIANGSFSTKIEIRDSLVIVESISRKRFLGFLWKTQKIKDRKVDAVSKNPYNKIVSLERITIEN